MKQIKESPHYLIDVNGIVYSKLSKKNLKPRNNNGYLMVYLKVSESYSRWFYIHRLIGNNFIPNPQGKPEINHKDGNKANNNINNLEWVTKSENHIHAHKTGLKKPSKHRTGTQHSEETKKLMSDAKKGEKHPKFKGWYKTPIGKFTSSKDAENAYKAKGIKLNAKTIYNRCKKGLDKDFYFINK